jgi:UDP-glucuronate decarboxylase
MNRHILVAGGTSFLGSYHCDRLIERCHKLLCFDNFFTGTKRNEKHLIANPNFELMRHDVTFPRHGEFNRIFNLARPTSPIHNQHNPVQTTTTSVHGAINMLGLARRVKVRLLQASTIGSP